MRKSMERRNRCMRCRWIKNQLCVNGKTVFSSFFLCFLLICSFLSFVSCSTTKCVPEDDQLFVGLTGITYQNYEKNDNFTATQEEMEAALATEPNGALFGSSYYCSPFPIGLWIWNAYAGHDDYFSRWMTSSFGKQPVLMSWVNPSLRASVAQSVLRNHGYFQGRVSYENKTLRNPRKAKIGYTVDMGPLYTLDSIAYLNFPQKPDSLIRATASETRIHVGDPFTVSSLDAERNRISSLFRNHGYYYYQPGFASYLADTLAVPGKVQLRFQLADSLPSQTMRQWYIGRVCIDLKKTFMQTLTDSVSRRFLKVRFGGKRPPVRPRVIMGNMRLRPRQLYNYDNYQETLSRINSTGLFSIVNLNFTPREGTDTLDVAMNCTLEKPYDFYIETNFNGRTIGRYGPELKMGVTRRNAFRGGEKLDVNVHGAYEWLSHRDMSSSNYYEYGMDASIEFPRLIAPYFGGNHLRRDKNGRIRRLFYSTPSTLAKFSTDVIQRPGFYKMHVVSGEWTYRWQTSPQNHHEFSPLTVKYQFMNSRSHEFDSIVAASPYLMATMEDYFIPSMRYTYIYNSPSRYRHPIRFEATLSESGNIVSLGMIAAGRKWGKQEKNLFKNPYSQFVRLETDFVKTWRTGAYSSLVGHINAGVLCSYGNSEYAPFSERFYVGGANSVRAFSVRGVGPGRFPGLDKKSSYLLQNGDVKFVANLEYRSRLSGNLHGAVFLDAGNVWLLKGYHGNPDYDALFADTKFRVSNFLRELAIGTGVGVRYDLDFLILRLDWGFGLHVPSDTGKNGFYNIRRFKDVQTLHFAIGMPF